MKKKLKKIKHVAMDMDGTIYCGSQLFPETKPFLSLLEKLNISYSFLTNNSSKNLSDYIFRLKNFGIDINANQIINSTVNTIDYLKQNHPEFKGLYLLGTDGFKQQIIDAGFDVVEQEPEAVVVGFDPYLDFEKLCKAAYWIRKGAFWISTHPDLECPTDLDTVWIDCGAVTACLEKLCNCRAQVLGKPNPSMLDTVARRAGVERFEIAMIGDRMQTDIRMAKNAGALGVHITAAPGKIADSIADISVKNLAEFGAMLKETAK